MASGAERAGDDVTQFHAKFNVEVLTPQLEVGTISEVCLGLVTRSSRRYHVLEEVASQLNERHLRIGRQAHYSDSNRCGSNFFHHHYVIENEGANTDHRVNLKFHRVNLKFR